MGTIIINDSVEINMKTKLLFALIAVAVFGETLIAGIVEEAHNTSKQGNDTQAFKLYKEACNDGDAESCWSLGVSYKSGKGVKQDYIKAVELYQKSCDMGDATGCWSLGRSYHFGEGVKQDKSKAEKLYQKACNMGDAQGCVDLGIMYHGEGVKQDHDKAAKFYERACDLEESDSCFFVGDMYGLGLGAKKDYDKAFKLIKKGCNSYFRAECAEIYQKECELEDKSKCVEMYYDSGVSIGISPEEVKHFQKLCDKGNAPRCMALGYIYKWGKVISDGEFYNKDYIKSERYYRKACDLHFLRSCYEYAELKDKKGKE